MEEVICQANLFLQLEENKISGKTSLEVNSLEVKELKYSIILVEKLKI